MEWARYGDVVACPALTIIVKIVKTEQSCSGPWRLQHSWPERWIWSEEAWVSILVLMLCAAGHAVAVFLLGHFCLERNQQTLS